MESEAVAPFIGRLGEVAEWVESVHPICLNSDFWV